MTTEEKQDLDLEETGIDWYEIHLSCADIKSAIHSWLSEKGYYVRPETLRIYGYRPDDEIMSAFQGHIKVSD